MNSTLKTWTTLGLIGALAGGTLAGCSGGEAGEGDATTVSGEAGAGEAGEAVGGEAGSGEGGSGEGGSGEGGESGEAGDGTGALPLVNRLAFMAGHVEAGLALYRAGDAEAAAPHLLHPVSETHADERKGLEGLGFEPAIFEEVSKALEAGKSAAEIEPQLKAAEENLAAVRKKAGGEPELIIAFLTETLVKEYAVAVQDGKVTDAGEYQDAYGFAVVAKSLAGDLEGDASVKVGGLLDEIIALFPQGAPIPPADPAPVGQVSALASKVALALP